ncbi:hypothetical protein D3C72_1928900 [compost metagenome]
MSKVSRSENLHARAVIAPLAAEIAAAEVLSQRARRQPKFGMAIIGILLLGKNRPCVLLQRCEHGRFLVALPGLGGGVSRGTASPAQRARHFRAARITA